MEKTTFDPIMADQKRMEADLALQSIRALTDLLSREQNYRTGVIDNRFGLSEKEQTSIKSKLIDLVTRL